MIFARAIRIQSKLSSFASPLAPQTIEQSKDPRTETFFDMLRLNMCPQLTLFSFTVIFAIFLMLIFGLQLGIDGIARDNGTYTRARAEFLPIETNGKLTGALSNKNTKIKENYQLYRPLTSLIVHNNFDHIVSNSIMLIIWASYFEVFLGKFRTPLIFVITGVIGNLGSAAFDGPTGNALGASTGLFGIVGSIIGYLILNWNNMSYPGSPRTSLIIQLVFILLLTVLLSGRFSQTIAHLCGLVAGVFVGCFLSQKHNSPNTTTIDATRHEKVTRSIGVAVTTMIAVTFLLVTILVK